MFTFNTAKLRGRIVEKYKTILEFSKQTRRGKQFVLNVLNNKSYLNHEDMDEWIRLLEIPADEIDIYFFNH
jgi:hypothetical protein